MTGSLALPPLLALLALLAMSLETSCSTRAICASSRSSAAQRRDCSSARRTVRSCAPETIAFASSGTSSSICLTAVAIVKPSSRPHPASTGAASRAWKRVHISDLSVAVLASRLSARRRHSSRTSEICCTITSRRMLNADTSTARRSHSSSTLCASPRPESLVDHQVFDAEVSRMLLFAMPERGLQCAPHPDVARTPTHKAHTHTSNQSMQH
mmetsp:Transcript_127805/g.226470  ORF Transcript_127805/g.226470 Transcript_127805/m.226470 type:complete len:212 (+) Transcript_127805:78-713(+)